MSKMFIIPHSHYDAEVFKTREEYLEWGFSIIFDVLKMLKIHKDYKFTLDQVALIKPFLERYPEMKETFVEMVQGCRLEIACGMYVMPDVNIPSGESLIRQILIGKGYCKKELGIDVKTGWLIDTFGHHPQMPQLMKKSGFEYYVFSRVADTEKSEFYWNGLDGTKIMSHWMPYHYDIFYNSPQYIEGFSSFAEDTYNKLKKYSATDNVIALEGIDFNPPVRHTMDCVNEYNNTGHKSKELKVATPLDFFKELEKSADKLNNVYDDLNPIFQGCYSARIAIKQWNRYMENLLYSAEVFDAVLSDRDSENKKSCISDSWELVLFNQFHDVICGVQTDKVFENVMLRYKEAEFLTRNVLDFSIEKLISDIDTRGDGIPVIVFNQLNWERTDIVETMVGFDSEDIYDISVINSENMFVPFQTEAVERNSNGSIKQAKVLFVAKVESLGYEVFRILENTKGTVKNEFRTNIRYGTEELDEGIIENEFYKIKADLWKGSLKSIVLKETGEEFVNRDIPYLNMLIKEEDNGDFWEVGVPLRGGANRPVNRVFPLSSGNNAFLSVQNGGSSGINEGDVRTDFHFVQKAAYGKFETTVSLYKGLKRIDINTHLINNEENVRYRIAFPVDINNGTITHEIPFGNIERPEGEFPAGNWVDYSDSNKGIGLLNCGLPGNAVINNTMFLSVLKATSFVNYGDVGGFSHSVSSAGGFEKGIEHSFKYALLPHSGSCKNARLYKHGLELNNPLINRKSSCKKGVLPQKKSFFGVNKENIILSCFKRNGNSIIIRLYEGSGLKTEAVEFTLDWCFGSVYEVNLIEEKVKHENEIIRTGNGFIFDISPFEIKTFKIEI